MWTVIGKDDIDDDVTWVVVDDGSDQALGKVVREMLEDPLVYSVQVFEGAVY